MSERWCACPIDVGHYFSYPFSESRLERAVNDISVYMIVIVWAVAILLGVRAFAWWWLRIGRRQQRAMKMLTGYLVNVKNGDTGAAKVFGAEGRENLANEAANTLMPRIVSPSPLIALRECVGHYGYEYARYGVLVHKSKIGEISIIDGAPGVTGELCHHLHACVESTAVSPEFREELQAAGENLTDDDILAACQIRFIQFCTLFTAAVIACSEFEPEDGSVKWATSMLRHLAAFHEDQFREQVGLPSVLEATRGFAGLKHATILYPVFRGEPDPERSWHTACSQ